MDRIYQYVGPADIRRRAASSPRGAIIESVADLTSWVREAAEQPNEGGVVATFVVNLDGFLCLADRRSEHVACAGDEAVLSAGEITFVEEERSLKVEAVSNQSTGYCPDPSSWQAVESALDRLGVAHAGKFTAEVVFRRCPACGQTNIVKDDWFACDVCGGELPLSWNF